jgi:hypothetical protein
MRCFSRLKMGGDRSFGVKPHAERKEVKFEVVLKMICFKHRLNASNGSLPKLS